MGYSIGFSKELNRYIGYGVIAVCDHSECQTVIDRGMGCACCDGLPHHGNCLGYFCAEHIENYLYFDELEDLGEDELSALGLEADDLPEEEDNPVYKCKHTIAEGKESIDWLNFILTDDTWAKWREVNPTYIAHYKELLQKNESKKAYVLVQKLEQPIID